MIKEKRTSIPKLEREEGVTLINKLYGKETCGENGYSFLNWTY